MSDGMFLRACRELAPEYPDVKYDEDLLDRVCLRIVQNPGPYAERVMVMPNVRPVSLPVRKEGRSERAADDVEPARSCTATSCPTCVPASSVASGASSSSPSRTYAPHVERAADESAQPAA